MLRCAGNKLNWIFTNDLRVCRKWKWTGRRHQETSLNKTQVVRTYFVFHSSSASFPTFMWGRCILWDASISPGLACPPLTILSPTNRSWCYPTTFTSSFFSQTLLQPTFLHFLGCLSHLASSFINFFETTCCVSSGAKIQSLYNGTVPVVVAIHRSPMFFNHPISAHPVVIVEHEVGLNCQIIT